MEEKSIARAVAVLGSQSLLAKEIEVSPQFINQLVTGSRPVPATLVLKIESATNGAVTRHELRPDIFGAKAA